MAAETPDQPISSAIRRRQAVRRGRASAAFRSGRGNDPLGAPRGGEPDEVDEAIEVSPTELDARAAAMGIPRASVPPPPPHIPTPADDLPEGSEDSPMRRMFDVARAGSPALAKEYRMGVLHKLLLRKIPLDVIARQLGVSVHTIEKDRAELKKRLRAAAKELHIDELIGNQTGFYDEVAAMAMRIASSDTPTPMKLAALRTALTSNADKARFYQAAGVFDVLKFRRSEDGEAVSDVQELMTKTEEMLKQMMSEDSEIPDGGKARKHKGFGGFEATDGTDHAEVVDL